ncbi:MAG: SCP2 sterol-binding domain-containing protein [Pseudomonadota bacterium]
MSDVINAAVSALSEKVSGEDIGFTARFDIEGEGAVRIAEDGSVSADDADADLVMGADAETFQGIMSGDTNPTSAYMSGKLTIEGDMGQAMKLGAILS